METSSVAMVGTGSYEDSVCVYVCTIKGVHKSLPYILYIYLTLRILSVKEYHSFIQNFMHTSTKLT